MTKEYIIEIDPSMLKILGPNMYKNIYFILGELIANAWDADARNVYIFLDQNKLILEDDGNGMSYSNGDIQKYLKVGQETRNNLESSFTSKFQRKKMGRKGLGKLAALSLSDPVRIMTSKLQEKSGFILTKKVNSSGILKGLKESEIKFKFIKESGTAIVMENPTYIIQKDPKTIAKNISRIFPFTDENFQIHIMKDIKHPVTIKNSKNTIAKELATIITLGKEFEDYAQYVDSKFWEKKEERKISLILKNNDNKPVTKDLIIKGWIGTYKSTSGRKSDILDFQDNFVSLYANGKIGEFNILEKIGRNQVMESYMVGELHIDLFEDSDLPDMAISNREGYIANDPRYEAALTEARKLLDETIKLRRLYADNKNQEKAKEKLKKQKDQEKELIEKRKIYKEHVNNTLYDSLKNNKVSETTQKEIVKTLNQALDDNLGLIGLKTEIDAKKKKLLISHTTKDKFYVDLIYSMLLFNNLPEEEILYTNSENEESRIPQGESVFGYLRDFFVNSASNEKIYVAYITSEKMRQSWGAVAEVGAGWITKSSHNIFNIANKNYKPEKPLNVESVWNQANVDYKTGDIIMNKLNADDFCSKVETITRSCGYKPNSREKNYQWLTGKVLIN